MCIWSETSIWVYVQRLCTNPASYNIFIFSFIITCVYIILMQVNYYFRLFTDVIKPKKKLLLTIINLLKKNQSVKTASTGSNMRVYKRGLPMNKEWYNSIYKFNKNLMRFLPSVNYSTFELFNWYFNAANNYIEKKRFTRKYREIRRTSGKKFWISNPEIKHYNDKLIVTIYVYSKLYNFLKKKLQLFEFTDLIHLNNLEKVVNASNSTYLNKIFIDKYMISNNYNNYIEAINLIKWNKYQQMIKHKSTILSLINADDKSNLLKLLKTLKLQHYNYLHNQLNKQLLYLKFKQLMLFNKFKYNELYLNLLIKFLQIIYKKNVVCNVVTLKHYYMSASILLQIIQTKIKSPRKRGKYLIPVDFGMASVTTPILSKSVLAGEAKHYTGMQSVTFDNTITSRNDYINKFLLTNNNVNKSSDDVRKLVLSNLENKTLAGLFIKVTGRLTKRYKAQRAIKTLRFKGTLRNVYSAHRNLPSFLSRGYDNINIEKKRVDSNTRVGAFGLTGWIASY